MNRIEELREKFKNVSALSIEELTELDGAYQQFVRDVKAGEVDLGDTSRVELYSEINDATQAIRQRAQELATAQAEEDEALAELEKAILPEATNETEEAEESADEETEEVAAEEAEAEAEAEATVEEIEEVVAEAEEIVEKAPLPALSAAVKKAPMRTAPARTEERKQMFKAPNGQEMNLMELAEAMVDKRSGFGRHTSKDVREQITHATFEMEKPEELTLKTGEDRANQEKVNAVVASLMDPMTWRDQDEAALTAAGGWCAPVETRYDIEVIAGAHRPVRDGLPSFRASRGGIQFRPGLSISDARGYGGVGVWTAANDANPSSPTTKDVGNIECLDPSTVSLDAVYRQLQIGNFQSIADPEGVAAAIKAVTAVWAETAEVHLIDAIAAAATNRTTDQHWGLARDFLNQVDRWAANYRYQERLPRDARLRVLLPDWFIAAYRTDLALGLQSDPAFLSVTEQQIVAQLAVRNINVSFYSDNPTGQTSFIDSGAGDIAGWPTQLRWFGFHEGAFLHLENGSLDIGQVRDSTLNSTNDYQIFAEDFENVAFVGVRADDITSTVGVNGTSSAGKDLSAQLIS